MKKDLSDNILLQLIFLSLLVFLSRLPFLWAGYGSEEDAWLLPLTAKNIALSGIYELSRAPGHPLQELLYSILWNAGPFAYNLLSAVASVIATLFFALSLKQLDFKHYLFASFAFAFTPVVFISSTYTIDYMFAMAFIMASFYFLLKNKILLAGVLLGLSIGFRITSGAMLIPFCILLIPDPKRLRAISFLVFVTALIGLLTYLPVIKTYGFSFFTYADQFPYPNIPKVIYKASIGAFGAIGILTIVFYKLKILLKKFQAKENLIPAGLPKQLFYASCAVVIIYLISYLRLPQKSAYMIPTVPFIILLFGYFLSSNQFKIFCVLFTFSSFFASINLTDSLRGSAHSKLSATFHVAGQEIFFDPFTGPVYSDHTKRINKMHFTKTVLDKIKNEEHKTVLICGWWYTELSVEMWEKQENKNVELIFYLDKSTMDNYIADGYTIYYLPEQNLYNDQCSNMHYTDSVSKPYL